MNKCIFTLTAGILVFMYVSCASIQKDIFVSNLNEQDMLSVSEIERQIILQDGAMLSGSGSTKTDSSGIVAQIDAILAHPGVSENARARLYALKGRALLAEGKTQSAVKQLKTAQQINPGDPQVLILEYRLDPAAGLDSRIELSDETAPLIIESATELYRQGKYAESAAAFDSAFISLDPVYIEAYGAVRDKAWTLKDISSADKGKTNISYVNLTKVSVQEMVQIVNDTSDVLVNITGGKKMNAKDLFSRLNSLNMFAPVSAPGSSAAAAVSQNQTVTRIICARFLWNLHTVKNSKRSQSAAYSAAYRAMPVPESPVPDVAVSSPDFDAVLGCVENEIMDLPDGIHFFPEQTFSAAELFSWIKNLK